MRYIRSQLESCCVCVWTWISLRMNGWLASCVQTWTCCRILGMNGTDRSCETKCLRNISRTSLWIVSHCSCQWWMHRKAQNTYLFIKSHKFYVNEVLSISSHAILKSHRMTAQRTSRDRLSYVIQRKIHRLPSHANSFIHNLREASANLWSPIESNGNVMETATVSAEILENTFSIKSEKSN